METLLSHSFDYLSSQSPQKIRKGLRQVEGLLAQICLSRNNARANKRLSMMPLGSSPAPGSSPKKLAELHDDPAFREFFKLQQGFQWNIATRLVSCLERLLGKESNGTNDLLVIQALDLIQGVLLLHPPSRELFSHDIHMNLFLDLLDPANCPAIQSATLLALVTSLLDNPQNTRSFESADGLLVVTSLFKARTTSREVKLKLVEFLYFYLMPETPAPRLATSSSASNTAVLGGRGRELVAAFDRRRETVIGGDVTGKNSTNTKTTDEKQKLLGKYLSSVQDLVEDLKEGGGPFKGGYVMVLSWDFDFGVKAGGSGHELHRRAKSCSVTQNSFHEHICDDGRVFHSAPRRQKNFPYCLYTSLIPEMSILIPPQPGARYMDTTTAYDLWSEVYDTDGNFLQALDTIEMRKLLPRFLSLLSPSPSWKLVDLGCGTGRALNQLLNIPNASLIGLDASPKMLDIAKNRLGLQNRSPNQAQQVSFAVYDLLNGDPPEVAGDADGVVSTLVLEHIPISDFFQAASKLLLKNGIFLVTNMHSDMGQLSQAGFIDPHTGEKVRPMSYAHTTNDVLVEATRQGFHLVGDVLERAVDEETSQKLGTRSRKWIGVTVWFAMMFRKTA